MVLSNHLHFNFIQPNQHAPCSLIADQRFKIVRSAYLFIQFRHKPAFFYSKNCTISHPSSCCACEPQNDDGGTPASSCLTSAIDSSKLHACTKAWTRCIGFQTAVSAIPFSKKKKKKRNRRLCNFSSSSSSIHTSTTFISNI